jgi:hypothetical protein
MKTMNELIITLPSDREVTMTRAFDAPRPLVFDALTNAALKTGVTEGTSRSYDRLEEHLQTMA